METNTANTTKQSSTLRRSDLLEPELSYQIVGVLYDVYNGVGAGYAERVYQRAVGEAFAGRSIEFREQVTVPIMYRDKLIARHIVDFVVAGRVVLELKCTPRIFRSHYDQVKGYLQSLNLSLGIIANFGPKELVFRRVVRIDS